MQIAKQPTTSNYEGALSRCGRGSGWARPMNGNAHHVEFDDRGLRDIDQDIVAGAVKRPQPNSGVEQEPGVVFAFALRALRHRRSGSESINRWQPCRRKTLPRRGREFLHAASRRRPLSLSDVWIRKHSPEISLRTCRTSGKAEGGTTFVTVGIPFQQSLDESAVALCTTTNSLERAVSEQSCSLRH